MGAEAPAGDAGDRAATTPVGTERARADRIHGPSRLRASRALPHAALRRSPPLLRAALPAAGVAPNDGPAPPGGALDAGANGTATRAAAPAPRALRPGQVRTCQ